MTIYRSPKRPGIFASLWTTRWTAGDLKQNSPETEPLSCEHLVGVRRFELLTSSVSGKRSPPELNAQMERTTGLEPATPTLARLCSTN